MAGQPPHPLQPRVGRSDGKPWSERKKWVWWDAAQAKWIGYDVPDFTGDQAAQRAGEAGRHRPGRAVGHRSVHHEGRRQGWLFVPDRLVDGPLPTHYEPAESPVQNLLYAQQSARCSSTGSTTATTLCRGRRSAVPCVITTYRLTEHYLAGAMSRWQPVAGRAAAGAVHRAVSPSWPQEKRHRATSTGYRSPPARTGSAPRRSSPGACARSRSTARLVHHVGHAVALGLQGARHRRRRERADRAGRRPQRDDPRGQGVRVQRGSVGRARRRPLRQLAPSRWASSPTRPSASAARRARWPATSGTSCPATRRRRQHAVSGDSYDNTARSTHRLAARQVHRAVQPDRATAAG